MNMEQETAEEKLPSGRKHKTDTPFCAAFCMIRAWRPPFFRTFFVKYPEWCLTFFGNGCIVNVTMVSMVA